MALEKQSLNIPFVQGLDTKTDPKQVSPGKFLAISNSVFDTGGLLKKRNGFGLLTTLPDATSTSLTTYNGNLVALGTSLNAFSPDTSTWFNKGSIVPINVSVSSLVRTANSQLTVDSAVSSNGIVCSAWKDSNGNAYYQIVDSNNGNIIAGQTQLPANSKLPRVFLLGTNFVITFLRTITATPHLQYIAIPILNVLNPGSVTDISTQVSSDAAGYDGQIINGSLYVSWDGSDVGGAVRTTWIDSMLNQHGVVANTLHNCSKVSVCGDITGSPNPTIWITFTDNANNTYSMAKDFMLGTVLAPTLVLAGVNVQNLTSTAQQNINTIYYETVNTYSYSSVRSDYLSKVTITNSGTVGSPSVILRSVGIASKAFLFNSTAYMLVAYGGAYQPSYFLINSSGQVIAKIAYSNGSGYPSTEVLPNYNVYGDVVSIGYLFKDQIIAVNKTQNVDSVGGLFGQLGINLANFTFNSQQQTVEIGGALHINGGYLRMYDGSIPVEHGFFLWPEDLLATIATTGGGLKAQQYFYQGVYEWTDSQGNIHRSAPSIATPADSSALTGTAVTFTSIFTSGAKTITVSSIAGLHVGQVITDNTTGANLTPDTKITAINGLVLTLNQATAGNSGGGGDTLQTVNTLKNTVNFPTLRITSKVGVSKVRLVLYRWSTDQQNYFQVTSISSPTLNDPTVDSIAIIDGLNDAEILGNPLIYTTGGVVENIIAPACNAMTLFKSRLMLIDAEDTNRIWFSKTVIENTPVEMSDLFTKFIAPTTGASGSTGAAKVLFPMDDKLIAYKADAEYYMTGTGPDNTGANDDFSDFVFITSTIGSDNLNSPVFMPMGIVSQSDKGLWLLGRDLSSQYIGAPVEAFNSSTVLSALTIPATNQIRFTMDSNVTLFYDYYYGQWGTFTGINGISSCLYQSKHTYLNSFGQVFQETPGVYLDGSNPVLMSFSTGWMNLAGVQGYERAYFFYILGQYYTPHKVQIQIAYDYSPSPSQTSIFLPDNFSPAFGGDSLYGGSSPWGGNNGIEQFRVFLQQQKCEAFQIKFNEIYDSSFAVPAGAGLTLTGMNLVVGAKSKYPRLNPKYSVG